MSSIAKRRWKNGRTTYRVLIRLKGHDPVSATFDRLRDAKEWAIRAEAELRAGRHGVVHRTLDEVLERYLAEVVPAKRAHTRASQAQQLQWWRERLGRIELDQIAPADIVRWRDQLSNARTACCMPYSPATVRQYLAVLSHVFTIAVGEWGWVPRSVAGGGGLCVPGV